MIPKRIYTIWFGEQTELIKKCIASQQIPGYEHVLINENNLLDASRYVKEALGAIEKLGVKRFCKASDFLRLLYLYLYGGIYLDADMEVLPGQNFDDLLDNKMFVGQDENGFYSSAAMGSEAQHPHLGWLLAQVEDNFRGDGGWIWEPGMELFSKMVDLRKEEFGIKILPSEVFFPYHWKTGDIRITEKTKVYHHYCGSWV